MPLHEAIKYKFNFGQNTSITIETDSLEQEMQSWIDDSAHMKRLWESSRTDSAAFQQYDSPQAPLSAVIRSFFDIIANDNQHPSTVSMKKQVVLLTDYIPINVTDAMNTITNVNEQKLGIFHEMNLTDVRLSVDFPVYSAGADLNLTGIRDDFQKALEFEFPPSVYQGKPLERDKLFMMEFDSGTLHQIVENAASSDLCSLPSNKMLSDFLTVRFARNGSIHVGEESGEGCDGAAEELFDEFAASAEANQQFVSLLVTDSSCLSQKIANFSSMPSNEAKMRLISSQNLDEAYDQLILPLVEHGFLNSTKDRQVVLNTAFYLTNFSTSCASEIPLVPLLSSRPYHRPKHLYIALDDMLWITVCATISVSVFGIIIYQQQVKRQQKKQMEILTEMMLQPRVYKTAKECPKVARLPWEIKSDHVHIDREFLLGEGTISNVYLDLFRTAKECPKVARLPWEIKSDHVHIDREFLLGEGTISNVYLGKLKGKAPILQWIGRVEMKQYQDCPVAVRVPRHFDEPEEDQLFREISSMRRLRHHDHIALFLGESQQLDS
ncbi:unnamed protein product [Heligmosomoides polygyrus]|uniref:Protein kinase domain-containing protein n=2 Tax=Heligmosomoides polygyrus TaxID=6339 RepID=A0A183GNH1_HELPZ|nr:unnamed protein product [Heligmosomoides polygyrus]